MPETPVRSIRLNNKPLIKRAEKRRKPQATPSFFTKQRLPPPYLQILISKRNTYHTKSHNQKTIKPQQNTRKPPTKRPKSAHSPILAAKNRFSEPQNRHNRLSFSIITKKQMSIENAQPESKMKKNPPKRNSLHHQRTMPFDAPKMHHAYTISSKT